MVLLVLFFVRPGVSRLKARIVSSISQAVARPVKIGSVHIRFLPQPGFDLKNLVIEEDPAFGAEPMLRAPEVTALVRLSSLARGRLDISRLELTEPSLNLVRRPDGRWSWEALLERTARTPLAPTAKSEAEKRPGFPYIEASSGRINFKVGAEKTPYALLNADFALWQESENAWGARLKAEPLRMDMSLGDTGAVRMSGTWQRAGSLRETPLQFSLEWQHAQLGQLTKLFSGNDKGWRGDVRLEATLSGTPGSMQVAADAAVRDFRRYDISTSEELTLAAHCDSKYSSAEAMMHEIFCTAPVGNGMVTLHGDAGRPGSHRMDLSLNVENVPVASVAELVRRAKKDLPADFVARGSVQGNFSVKEDGALPGGRKFEGHGEFTNLRLQSASDKAEVAAANVPFMVIPQSKGEVHPRVRRTDHESLPPPDELRIEYGPFPLPLGRIAPAQVRGWVGRSGYALTLRGDAEVSRTLRVASLLGLPAMRASAEGAAQLDLQMAGAWARTSGDIGGFNLPTVTGTVQLRDVRATVRGVNGPIEIVSAGLKLATDETRIEKFSARAADARWTGSLDLPRGCGIPGACLVQFNLNADEVGLSEIHQWLDPHTAQRRWYQVLSAEPRRAAAFLETLHASGKVNVTRLRIRDLVAGHVTASVELERGKLRISDLRAELLGGNHRGDWQADFTAAAPVYTGYGTLTNISLGAMASAMQDEWITGTGGGTYTLRAAGLDGTGFWQSAQGGMSFNFRNGALPHISLASDEGPLQVSRWDGHARLHDGTIEIERGELVSPAGAYEVSGTASLGRVLDFKLVRGPDLKAGAGSMVYSITGTVAEPRVVTNPMAETQARLKP